MPRWRPVGLDGEVQNAQRLLVVDTQTPKKPLLEYCEAIDSRSPMQSHRYFAGPVGLSIVVCLVAIRPSQIRDAFPTYEVYHTRVSGQGDGRVGIGHGS